MLLRRERGEGRRQKYFALTSAFCLLTSAFSAAAQTLTIVPPVHVSAIPFTITGTAVPNREVRVAIGRGVVTTKATDAGTWSVEWTTPLSTGTYEVTASSGGVTATETLRVQIDDTLRRKPLIPVEQRFGEPELPGADEAVEMTDRWRISPPPYELDESSRGRLDPYNKNVLKGDLPIIGNDLFLVVTGIADTLAESRTLPTPSGVSAVRPDSVPFFGRDDQNFFAENVTLSAELFEGDTAFEPIRQRVKITVIGNFNYIRVEENAVVKPDVRRGTERRDGRGSVQELFYERKLRDLTPNFDFFSIRAGSQPFNSDFRGFVFSDTNLGVRFFGNYASNRFQYNAAIFDRLEKDTNSGLNRPKRRGQQVAVANFYWQDFIRKGFTQQFSIHYVHDDASFYYDRNGILVRPAPVGAFTPHEIDAAYLGAAGFGHFGRINVDYATYYVLGRDTLNPIAGPDPQLRGPDSVRISAGMAALELSYDRDWLRPRVALFYATGDRRPRDRKARGFDSIFDAAAFAGGGFSFFNRLGIRLAGTGVALVERGSLLASLRSSKDEGQPNYVNPGVQLASIGLDIEVTPRLKAITTANYIRLDATQSIEALLFQPNIRNDLGTDLSVGLRYRPFLNQNVVVVGGAAAFIPGGGFQDIYESGKTLFHVFTNLILTF